MKSKQVASAVSYLSIFFIPMLVPIIVYFIEKDTLVRDHSKRALLSHIIPYVFLLLFGLTFIALAKYEIISNSLFGVLIIALLFIFIIILSTICIWNVLQAVKVMR